MLFVGHYPGWRSQERFRTPLAARAAAAAGQVAAAASRHPHLAPRRSSCPTGDMTRGGRNRRGSSRGGEALASPSAGPAVPQPAPLSDVSNSARPATALAALKSPAAAPVAAAARAAALPPPLPGLEDEEGMPAKPRGRLPVAQEAFQGFGDALGCLR